MSIGLLRGHADQPGRRIAVEIEGQRFDQWTRAAIDRNLSEICGSFQLELRDTTRNLATWPYATAEHPYGPFRWGVKVRIFIDGELLLVGWIEDVNPSAQEGVPQLSISGRDIVGDLVDCAAAPLGPTEFKNLNLLQIAERLCRPFGLKVRADVDVGDPFPRFTIDCGETVLSAIEKGARQRGLLVTSDGIEELVLTRSGQKRAAGDLSFPGNVLVSGGQFTARERFSDYYVKGQAEKAGGRRAKNAKLDATAEPLGAHLALTADDDDDDEKEKAGTSIMGHARDEEVTRYRPIVSMTRTQGTPKSAQIQAEWMMRNRRAKGDKLDYQLRDYRGETGRLWRPNELSSVIDTYQVVDRDLLIGGVTFLYDERGTQTRLRLMGPEAYDLDPDGGRRKNRHNKGKKRRGPTGPLDSDAQAL